MNEHYVPLTADPAVPSDLHGPPNRTSDVAAFSEFYREFMPTLVAFLMFKSARFPDAVEVAQDTMTKAYQRWSEIGYPKAWARTVASRALTRRIASSKEDLVEHLPEHGAFLPPSFDVETWEQRHEVLRVLDLLPPRQREVMAWTFEGYTPTEIATELQITTEAVRTNLMKARRTLAAYLGAAKNG